MVELKTEAEIEAMAAAGAVLPRRCARWSGTPRRAARPPSSTRLPRRCWPYTERRRRSSTTIRRGRRGPFPAVLCVSVNDAVAHGIPNGQVLADGDLVSVDFGATLRGWCGDAARSFVVGTARSQDVALIKATDEALAAGIAAVRPGNTLGDVGHAIAAAARGAGYGLLATTAATASAAPCTRIRTYPTKGAPERACGCGRAWSSRSSRC